MQALFPAMAHVRICSKHMGCARQAVPRTPNPRSAWPVLQGSKGGSATRMSGHHSRLMRLESSLFILPDLLQQRSSEFGGLVLEEFIGQGSFGRVYKGTPLRLYFPSTHLCDALAPRVEI